MGIGKLIEEVGGARAVEQAAEAVDPNAGVLSVARPQSPASWAPRNLSDTLEAHPDAKRDANQDAAQDAADANANDPGP